MKSEVLSIPLKQCGLVYEILPHMQSEIPEINTSGVFPPIGKYFVLFL